MTRQFTEKQRRKANKLEGWWRVGFIKNLLDTRQFIPPSSTTDGYSKRCICGLTYDRYNYMTKTYAYTSVLTSVVALGFFIFIHQWILIAAVGVIWILFSLFFLLIGHSLTCAIRRPLLALAGLFGNSGVSS